MMHERSTAANEKGTLSLSLAHFHFDEKSNAIDDGIKKKEIKKTVTEATVRVLFE